MCILKLVGSGGMLPWENFKFTTFETVLVASETIYTSKKKLYINFITLYNNNYYYVIV